MTNIQILQPLGNDDQKIVEMSAEQHNLELDYTAGKGSVKITDDLHRLALSAVQTRISETSDYTSGRIKKINSNWLTYHSQKNASTTAENSQTLSQYSGSEAFIACQDHLDDLTAIFNNWQEQLDLVDTTKTAFQYVATRLLLDETDEDPKMAKLRGIYNAMPEDEKQKMYDMFNTMGITDEYDTFYYQKKSAILSFLKHIVEKSGYNDVCSKAFLNLIVTGHLIVRDNYSDDSKSQLVRKETGEFDIEINREPRSRFVVVDPRNLIFGPTTDWKIEVIHTTFSQLLNICLDGNNKPIPNSRYDVGQLMKIADHIKRNGSSDFNMQRAGDEVNGSLNDAYYDYSDMSGLYDLDGNITLYEAHNIPMILDSSNRVYKCVITGIVVNSSKIATADNVPTDMVIIGVQKSPYIDGVAHHEINMFEKEDDHAGFGVIDAINAPYQLMNNLYRQLLDLTKPGRSGALLTMSDTDFPVKASNVGDREIINIKANPRTTKSIRDVAEPWPTDYNMINTIQNMLPSIENKLKLASRKGASGEKMSPNPTATELNQISNELQKSVNQVAIKVNNFLKDWTKRAYIYTVMNTFEAIRLNVQMERISNEGRLTTTEKEIELEMPDLFINGVSINLKAYDNYQNTEIQKQQIMQITNLLYTTGTVLNQNTGQPTILTDESGAQYMVSAYKLWKMILDRFDMDEVIIKTNTNQMQMNHMSQVEDVDVPGQTDIVNDPATTETPDINASPDMASILNQMQLSKGVNV